MNREIKFRAKRINNGEWAYGSLWIDCASGPTMISGDGSDRDCFNFISIETVGQYIGRKDKNGKEIYDGDYDSDGNCVVWCDRCNGWEFGLIDMPTKELCIPCHKCDGNFFFEDHINDFTITGNIHD